MASTKIGGVFVLSTPCAARLFALDPSTKCDLGRTKMRNSIAWTIMFLTLAGPGIAQVQCDQRSPWRRIFCQLSQLGPVTESVRNNTSAIAELQNRPPIDGLSCATGEIPVFNSEEWVCGEDQQASAEIIAEVEANAAAIAGNAGAIAGLQNRIGLADLDCATDEIAKFDGQQWTCAADQQTGGVQDVIDAICLQAEQIGSVRPLVCEPRCGCGDNILVRANATSCDEQADGSFDIGLAENVSRCEGNGLCLLPQTFCSCETCTGQLGNTFPCNCTGCEDGQFCSATFPGGPAFCQKTCSDDSECPTVEVNAILTLEVNGAPGEPELSQCNCTSGEGCDGDIELLNSNDGQACLDIVEAQVACAPAP